MTTDRKGQTDKTPCPKCGARGFKEAETKCIPEGDSCPAEDMQLWRKPKP